MKLIIILLSLLSFNAFALDVFTPGQPVDSAKINSNFTQVNAKARIELYRINGIHVPGSSSQNIVWEGSSFPHKITVNSNIIKFSEKGIYEVNVSMRNASDVWTRWQVKDSNNVVKGQSIDFGAANSSSEVSFLFEVTNESLNHYLTLYSPSAGAISVVTPVFGGRSIIAVIKKLD